MDCNLTCEQISKMVIVLKDCNVLLSFLVGYIVAIIIGHLFGIWVRSIKSDENGFSDEDVSKLWEKAIYVGKLTNNNAVLGALEITIFYFCLIFNRPEGIVAWLTFKIAAKWETWAHIIKLSDRITDNSGKETNGIEYLGARNRWATTVLQRFLIGTAGNIVFAFIGKGIFCLMRCF